MTGRPHVRTPVALLYADGLSEGAARLWQVLDDVCRDHASARLTVPALAAALARRKRGRDGKLHKHAEPPSARSIQRWRGELVDAGWLAWEPARGRGEASLWEPLRRVRAVLHAAPQPVDNYPGRVTGRATRLAPSDQRKGDTVGALDAPATRARPAEHGEDIDLRDLPDAGGWCGRCDPIDHMVQADDDARSPLIRCPSCHPAYVSPF